MRKLILPVFTILLVAACPDAGGQSPYGLAARQTIPFVVDETVQPPGGGSIAVQRTEIDVHNPGGLPITVTATYFGAFTTATPGRVACTKQVLTVGAGATAEFSLASICPLNAGLNFGRLELSTLAPGGQDDPAGGVFLASARVSGSGGYFAVEGFPQGNLSGNKRFAAVTGLKSGLVGGSQWRTACFGAALNEGPVPMIIRLVDGNGNALGSTAGAVLDPASGFESVDFPDIFTAVGAPPGNYADVTALVSTSLQGPGPGGPGVFGLCRIANLTSGQEAFQVAKYLDNNDEGRQHQTTVSRTSWGREFSVVAEVDESDKMRETNLHVAYFQHPDRVRCEVRFVNPDIPFFDLGQVRLIDPDGTVVAGGPGLTSFQADLGEKATRHGGRNGRWLIEVAPLRAMKAGGSLHQGGLAVTPYTLSCSSGNGHSQLDIAGHCLMGCTADKSQKGNKWFLCAFDMPFLPSRCYY
jgi:hypothetical protein